MQSIKVLNKLLKPQVVLLLLFVLNILSHWPHMHKPIVGRHSWRQTQTQANIQNFVYKDFNILNPRQHKLTPHGSINRMEFPLYQWCIAAIGKLSKYHIGITRWFTLFIGLCAVLGIFYFLQLFVSPSISILAAWCFAWSPSFYYFTINPLPDTMALCFGIWGLYFSHQSKVSKNLIGTILLGLATLVKLPFILFFIYPAIQAITYWGKSETVLFKNKLIHIIGFVLGISWYAWVIPSWDTGGIVSGGANVESSNVGYFIFKNLISVFPEELANYAALPFFIIGIVVFFKFRYYKKSNSWPFVALLGILCAFVIYEIKMLEDKHDYYFFVFYPLIATIIAFGIKLLVQYAKITALFLVFVLVPAACLIRTKNSWDIQNPPFPKEFLSHCAQLQAAVPADAKCIIGSDISEYIYFYYLNKTGFPFKNHEITHTNWSTYLQKGAKYMYSDSRKVDSLPYVKNHIDTMIYQVGDMRVYKLK